MLPKMKVFILKDGNYTLIKCDMRALMGWCVLHISRGANEPLETIPALELRIPPGVSNWIGTIKILRPGLILYLCYKTFGRIKHVWIIFKHWLWGCSSRCQSLSLQAAPQFAGQLLFVDLSSRWGWRLKSDFTFYVIRDCSAILYHETNWEVSRKG